MSRFSTRWKDFILSLTLVAPLGVLSTSPMSTTPWSIAATLHTPAYRIDEKDHYGRSGENQTSHDSYAPNSTTSFSSLPDVSSKSDFPNLEKPEFGQIWIREDNDFEKLKFWLDVWRAQNAHGGWNVKLHGPLEIISSYCISPLCG
jgi:hypothetical protein